MGDIFDRILGITPDPKIAELFLMGSPFHMIAILTVYVLFVKKWGPDMMKNRQAFELKGTLVIYNSFQIVINAYLFYHGIRLMFNTYIWKGSCYIADLSRPESMDKLYFLSHIYCLVKVLDLLDTIFFVLRKRYNQVSFLHFYHHILMCGSCYIFFRYMNNGHLTMIGLVNSGIHTLMYTYYLLSSLWPSGKNQLWWKKYITLLQIMQFIFILGFILYPLLHGELCGISKNLIPFILTQNILMLILFVNFYMKAYIVKAKEKI